MTHGMIWEIRNLMVDMESTSTLTILRKNKIVVGEIISNRISTKKLIIANGKNIILINSKIIQKMITIMVGVISNLKRKHNNLMIGEDLKKILAFKIVVGVNNRAITKTRITTGGEILIIMDGEILLIIMVGEIIIKKDNK
jgi:hypothetical protein